MSLEHTGVAAPEASALWWYRCFRFERRWRGLDAGGSYRITSLPADRWAGDRAAEAGERRTRRNPYGESFWQSVARLAPRGPQDRSAFVHLMCEARPPAAGARLAAAVRPEIFRGDLSAVYRDGVRSAALRVADRFASAVSRLRSETRVRQSAFPTPEAAEADVLRDEQAGLPTVFRYLRVREQQAADGSLVAVGDSLEQAARLAYAMSRPAYEASGVRSRWPEDLVAGAAGAFIRQMERSETGGSEWMTSA